MVRCKLLLPSQWMRKESEPASTNSSRKKSGSEIIRCVSSGRRVTRRSDWMIGAPNEMLGTKCPSITSTWMRSAPACSAWATCSPSRVKSAERIDGASSTAPLAASSVLFSLFITSNSNSGLLSAETERFAVGGDGDHLVNVLHQGLQI